MFLFFASAAISFTINSATIGNSSDYQRKASELPPECYHVTTINTECYTATLMANKNYCFSTSERGSLIIDGKPLKITGYVYNNYQFSGVGIAATISDLLGVEYIFVLNSGVTQIVNMYPLSLQTNIPAYIATVNNLRNVNLLSMSHYHDGSYISDFYLLGNKICATVDLKTDTRSYVTVTVDFLNEMECCGDTLSVNYTDIYVVRIFSSANSTREKVEATIGFHGALYYANIRGYIVPTNCKLYNKSDFIEPVDDSSLDDFVIYIIIACVVVVIIIIIVGVAGCCCMKYRNTSEGEGEPNNANMQQTNEEYQLQPTNYYQNQQPHPQQQQPPPPQPHYGQPEYMVTQPGYPQKDYDIPRQQYM
jgi:hypothetical protein